MERIFGICRVTGNCIDTNDLKALFLITNPRYRLPKTTTCLHTGQTRSSGSFMPEEAVNTSEKRRLSCLLNRTKQSTSKSYLNKQNIVLLLMEHI